MELGDESAKAQAWAAKALVAIWSFSSGEPFEVKPQTPQRTTKLPPSGITGIKNSVNHRRDSMALCMVGRAHLEHARSICPIDFALVLMPNRKNIFSNSCLRESTTPGPNWADYTSNRLGMQEYNGINT